MLVLWMMHLPSPTPDEQSFASQRLRAPCPQTRERTVLAPSLHQLGCELDDNTSRPIITNVGAYFRPSSHPGLSRPPHVDLIHHVDGACRRKMRSTHALGRWPYFHSRVFQPILSYGALALFLEISQTDYPEAWCWTLAYLLFEITLSVRVFRDLTLTLNAAFSHESFE